MTACLRIVLCEAGLPDQVIVGGACWNTIRQARAEFARVPGVSESDVVLDLLDRHGDIVDDKLITREIAGRLLGSDIAKLAEAAA